MKIDSIMVTGIYLIIWTIIVSVVWPLKLVLEGVEFVRWGQEFRLLFEILFLGWTASISLAILFRMIRYSNTRRLMGSLAFGVATPLVFFMFITISGFIFEGRVVEYIGQIVAKKNIAYFYFMLFAAGAMLYMIIYDHT